MQLKTLVINVSKGRYNLGAAKLANYLRSNGHSVTTAEGDPGMFVVGYDLVALSCIFSWHVPIAKEIALRVASHSDIWFGGPGVSFLGNWLKQEIGGSVQIGTDIRFEKQAGIYEASDGWGRHYTLTN